MIAPVPMPHRQQILDDDRPLRRHRFVERRIRPRQDPRRGELRQQPRHRLVERERALLDQMHRRPPPPPASSSTRCGKCCPAASAAPPKSSAPATVTCTRRRAPPASRARASRRPTCARQLASIAASAIVPSPSPSRRRWRLIAAAPPVAAASSRRRPIPAAMIDRRNRLQITTVVTIPVNRWHLQLVFGGAAMHRPTLRLPDQPVARGLRRPLEPDRAARHDLRRPPALPRPADAFRGGHRVEHPRRPSAPPDRARHDHPAPPTPATSSARSTA